MPELSVTHSRDEETMEAKTRWFQSLTLAERMDVFCQYTDLLLAANPPLMEQRDALLEDVRMLELRRAQEG